jgi:GNAT superfamily N-acetyltransferase
LSLYADYLNERLGKKLIETKHGFAVYQIFHTSGECYFEDVYIEPESRGKGYAREFLNEIHRIAKNEGCEFITGSVRPSANGSTDSLKVLLAGGFRLYSSGVDAIFFRKEI